MLLSREKSPPQVGYVPDHHQPEHEHFNQQPDDDVAHDIDDDVFLHRLNPPLLLKLPDDADDREEEDEKLELPR